MAEAKKHGEKGQMEAPRTLGERLRDLPCGDKASLALFALAFAVVLLTFRDYGYSWDEVFHNRVYGKAVLSFFTSFGKDLSATNMFNFYLYGGLFDAFTELVVRISPFAEVNARHLSIALVGLLGVAGCWKTARFLGGAWAGFWAALFLLLTAPYYGHMFINAKDIPLAAGYMWALYFLIRTVSEFPSPSLKTRLWFGAALGASLGIRIGGIMVVFYFLLLAAADLAVFWVKKREGDALLRRAGKIAWSSLPSFVLAYLTMIAVWPAALLHPFAVPFESFQAARHFKQFGWLLWNGGWVGSDNLPWNYLLVLFGVELPEALVVLLVGALPWALYGLWRAAAAGERRRAVGLGLLPFAALFPPVFATITNATMYDNMRHFLFVVPPLACIAGLAWAELLEFAGSRVKPAKIALAGLMAVLLLPQVQRSAALHPYEYTFKNIFAGGMPAAGDRFDTDYWITSYREATAFMVAHAREVAKREGVPFESRQFTVGVTGLGDAVSLEAPNNFKVLQFDPRQLGNNFQLPCDYVITMTRNNFDRMVPNWPVAGVIGRLGMRFSVVKVNPALR